MGREGRSEANIDVRRKKFFFSKCGGGLKGLVRARSGDAVLLLAGGCAYGVYIMSACAPG